jgi:predicted dehydrogenase
MATIGAGLHIVLLGCGTWGKLILRDLKQLGAEVTVIARSQLSRDRAEAGGADRIVSAVAEIARPVAGAVVASRSDQHAACVIDLAVLEVPVFVEKPLASLFADGVSAIAACPGRLFVMDKWRYHPGIERLRQLVSEGSLGAPVGIATQRLGWSMTHFELDPVWNLIPHDLAIIRHILGRALSPIAAYRDALGPDGGGLFAQLGAAGEPRATIEVSAHHPVNRRTVVVAGELGTAQLAGSNELQLVVRRGPPGGRMARQEEVAFAGPPPLLAELQSFLGFLKGGPPPMSGAEEALNDVAIIETLRGMAGIP